MIRFSMRVNCDNQDAEDAFWNEIQGDMTELENDIAHAIKIYMSETIYKGSAFHLVPHWEVEMNIERSSDE